MKKTITAAAKKRQADKMREIAMGIYDNTERNALLRFINDCEQMASGPPAKTRAKN